MLKKSENKLKRKIRARVRIFGTGVRPRLSFYKSNKHVFAQVINDEKGETLVFASDTEISGNAKGKVAAGSPKKRDEIYAKVGELIAQKAVQKKIKNVSLDRGGFRYHGLLKCFADGARKGGLIF